MRSAEFNYIIKQVSDIFRYRFRIFQTLGEKSCFTLSLDPFRCTFWGDKKKENPYLSQTGTFEHNDKKSINHI